MFRLVRFVLITSVLCLVGVGSASGQGPQADADLRLMQGKWIVVSASADGKEIRREKTMTVTFQGNVMTTMEGNVVQSKASITLDPSKTPRAVDFSLAGDSKVSFQGIYELASNGELKLCFSLTAQDRPTAFITSAGKDHALVIMKRMN